MAAFFEAVRYDAACRFCSGRSQPPHLDVDAAYCISLQEQPDRTAKAAVHFHSVGLCRHMTFYRALRNRDTTRGVWESHRAVAQEAIQQGHRRVLMLEDDVRFLQSLPKLSPRINSALARLKGDWMGLYLGHLPFGGYFVGRDLMRVRSTCTHAYIANTGLLEWLANTVPMSIEVPVHDRLGLAVDTAMMCLPGMYALFPMVAIQQFLGDRRVDPRRTDDGKRRRWTHPERWREWAIFHAPRTAQWIAAVLSPWHAVTLERKVRAARMGMSHLARAIRFSGLFDDAFYLEKYPDVARAGVDPLTHYFWHGAAEGRWPNRRFDPDFYSGVASMTASKELLLHYIQRGRAQGLPTIDEV